MTWGPIGGGGGGGGTSSATYTVTDALIVGAATTSGVRLDLASGDLQVREGDDSGFANVSTNNIYCSGSLFWSSDTFSTPHGLALAAGVKLRSNLGYFWSNNTGDANQTADTGLTRASAGVVAVKEATNNSATNIHQITASSGALSGASYTFTNALPDGAVILGVTLRVTTAVTGATSFDVGDGSDVDRYGAAVAVALNTTTAFSDATASPLEWRSANGNVVLTANGSNFTGGVVRICVHYMTGTAPTS